MRHRLHIKPLTQPQTPVAVFFLRAAVIAWTPWLNGIQRRALHKQSVSASDNAFAKRPPLSPDLSEMRARRQPKSQLFSIITGRHRIGQTFEGGDNGAEIYTLAAYLRPARGMPGTRVWWQVLRSSRPASQALPVDRHDTSDRRSYIRGPSRTV